MATVRQASDSTPYVIGLTGGIGSGKSTVAAIFAEFGAAVIDTDAIAHALSAPGGAAIPALRQAFGSTVLAADGSLDRAAMRRIAFNDPVAKARLEGILHPLILAEADGQCGRTQAPYVVLVVPLLIETGTYRSRVNRILVVDCSEQTQIERTMARSRLSAPEVRAIMAAQASRAERLAAADDTIDNDGPAQALRAQVERLHRDYLRGALRFSAQRT